MVVIALGFVSPAFADLANLVDQGVLVETNPEQAPEEEGEPVQEQTPVGEGVDATYISSGGWAVTGPDFIDVATYVFDFVGTGSVSAATLILQLDEIHPQNESAPIELSFFSDDGEIEVSDYSIGFPSSIENIDAFALTETEIRIDVTGAVNSSLNSSQFVGFRIKSSVLPSSVDESLLPTYTGVKFLDNPTLEFVPGDPPAVATDAARFDGYTMEVPSIDVTGVGEVGAQFRLVDPNELIFQLTFAELVSEDPGPPPLSGAELLDCAAFEPPEFSLVSEGIASFSTISGILDAPSVNLDGEQIAVRLEYIEGSEPWLFETLALGAVQSGPSDALISALGGGLVVEPAQDFVPLCHGWVLIGDYTRNRIVERNLISGETGATYPFNTRASQFTLDEENEILYFTVHPVSERLYKLDLNTGEIEHNQLSQVLFGDMGASYEYGFAPFKLSMGVGGDIFALFKEGEGFDPENNIPFADTSNWMGLLDTDGNFRIDSIPLEEPVRIKYEPVQEHLFLTSESNLATFDFNTATNALDFVPGTDIAVGASCTDFDISPDGSRLAYTCPEGNYGDTEFGIVDMDPRDYHNNDGEWVFNDSPLSASFNGEGTLLIAADNERVYVFDVVTHLILEDFELGLLEGESVRKVRQSRDEDYIYLFLQNDIFAANSKFYWMPTPEIIGTPLP